MMKTIFEEDIKKKTSKYGVMIQNALQHSFNEATDEFVDDLSKANENSAERILMQSK